MAFNNRRIFQYDENISYDEIKESLEDNNYFEEVTTFNILKHKLDLIDEYESESLNFVYGKYGYEYETNATYPKITKEKIIDTGDLMVKTAVISFWIANNHKILFSKKDEKSERMFAENILGNASYIQNISVDIKKIQEASKKGRLSDMWATSFEDRANNINKGQLYGSDVMSDPMFSETIDATQKLAGIIIDSEDKKIKIKLFKDGGMQVYGKLIEPLDPFLFDLINDLKDFLEWLIGNYQVTINYILLLIEPITPLSPFLRTGYYFKI